MWACKPRIRQSWHTLIRARTDCGTDVLGRRCGTDGWMDGHQRKSASSVGVDKQYMYIYTKMYVYYIYMQTGLLNTICVFASRVLLHVLQFACFFEQHFWWENWHEKYAPFSSMFLSFLIKHGGIETSELFHFSEGSSHACCLAHTCVSHGLKLYALGKSLFEGGNEDSTQICSPNHDLSC